MSSSLAIEGGVPIRQSMLPYGHQWIDNQDIDTVIKVLRSEWLTTGPAIQAFEEAFAQTVGAKYAVAVSTGTAALHAAVFVAGVDPSHEVVTTPMTFAATANCVRYQGGTVVVAEVKKQGLNRDPVKVEACITPKTKAIITVDYSGQPSDLDELNDLASKMGLIVIEDASHSLGATYKGNQVGALADLTTFSFHPVKHITTGEGGMVTTNNPDLAANLRRFRTHGIATEFRDRKGEWPWFYEMVELGFNYRLTDLQSALGLSQLSKLSQWIIRRREIATQYTSAFASLPEIETLTILPDRESSWHLYVIQLNLDRLRVRRSEVFKALRAENIGVNVHYIPVPWHPYYQSLGYKKGEWPVTENAYERIISLPIFPAMTDKDVDDVVMAVTKVINHFRK